MNTSSLLLSIIIPSYNMEEYIGNNLNQLTHAVNYSVKKNEPLELLTIATELTLIRESLERIENQYTVKNDNGIDENAS